jgi:UDP-GlcNAc:undecaprenyl-phosphate GlcNAc-1-phosphate transferase
MIAAATIVAISFFVSLILTMMVRRVALRIGMVDHPDGHRKLHQFPIALGGGAAVFLATAAILVAMLLIPNPWRELLQERAAHIEFLLLSGLVVVTVGILDDRVGLRGRIKLLGQIAAASVLILDGLLIENLAIFGYELQLGLLAVPFTLFWLLGAINAINLLDGIDGLAGILGVIIVCTIAVIAGLGHNTHVVIIALAFAGSLLGFLRFNFPPASVFLGDAGSMLIGLFVGALAIQGSLKGPGTVLLAAPLAALTIPLLDSVAAIVRRKLTGRSIYTTDRAHLHHHLLRVTGSNRRVLACVAIAASLTSAGAMMSVAVTSDWIALLVGIAVVALLAVTNLFGRTELRLVAERVQQFSNSFRFPTPNGNRRPWHSAVRLQGSRPWLALWDSIVSTATSCSLNEVRLSVDLPIMAESFHASWKRANDDHDGSTACWKMEIPLVLGGHVAGGLTIVGPEINHLRDVTMQEVQALLSPLSRELQALLEDDAPVDQTQRPLKLLEEPRLSATPISQTPAGRATHPVGVILRRSSR